MIKYAKLTFAATGCVSMLAEGVKVLPSKFYVCVRDRNSTYIVDQSTRWPSVPACPTDARCVYLLFTHKDWFDRATGTHALLSGSRFHRLLGFAL